jgi:hypothetical protein
MVPRSVPRFNVTYPIYFLLQNSSIFVFRSFRQHPVCQRKDFQEIGEDSRQVSRRAFADEATGGSADSLGLEVSCFKAGALDLSPLFEEYAVQTRIGGGRDSSSVMQCILTSISLARLIIRKLN